MKPNQIFVPGGFWISGQWAFLDVTVFDPNTSRYANHAIAQCYVKNEDEKKRNYNERILTVDNGSFTSLVFSIYGGMGRECRTFYKTIQYDCRKEKYTTTYNIVLGEHKNTKINFSLIKSCLLCLRGSRQVKENSTGSPYNIVLTLFPLLSVLVNVNTFLTHQLSSY